MKAYAIRQFGSPDVFECIETETPALQPGHIVIRVAASSINPLDCKIRQGKLGAITPDFPAILHGDVAGVVEEVADDVKAFKTGDEVYACAGGIKPYAGAIAEFMLADARLVCAKPKSLSLSQAAALPLVSITAWNAIVDRANVRAQQSVLIHGGTGGVGHIALQLAKLRGAKVYATVSSNDKAELARQLGADEVINYKSTSVQDYVAALTDNKGFDVVFDTVGGENIQHSFHAAALNGTVVSVSTRSQQDLSLMHQKGLSLHVVFMLIPLLCNIGREKHAQILHHIAQYVDEGKLKPLIDANQFAFSQIGKAHAYWESGSATGKIVLLQNS